MNIILHEVNGIEIGQRESDGYFNLTKMTKSYGKQIGHWLALESTKDYLQELSVDIGIPISELLEVKKGGSRLEQGTWGHPDIATECAQWCNTRLRLMVNRWFREWATTQHLPAQPEPPALDMGADEAHAEVVDTVAEEVKEPEPQPVDPRDREVQFLKDMVDIGRELDMGELEKRLIKQRWLKLLVGTEGGQSVKQPEQEPNWELPPGFQDQPRFPQPVQLAISVSERARALGYRLSPGQLIIAGNHASKEYKRRYGTAPEKRYRIIDDERTQYVNVYVSPRDLGILDAAIQAVAAVAG